MPRLAIDLLLKDIQSTNWLQQITGSFKDEPTFEEILAYGRSIRKAIGLY